MKVICDRAALLEALNLVGGVAAARTTKPVLSCVRLTAEDATLTLATTDQEVAVEVSTARVEVSEQGVALVPADKLIQIVRESIDPTLTVESKQDETHIRTADSHFKLLGYPADDFPTLPRFEGDASFELTAGDLHKAVAQTIFATARENSRYAINGVLFDRDKNKLSVVATDGHRLALAITACKAGATESRNAIVPTKALNILLKLFHDGEQTVKVQYIDNQILFASEGATLASNLVEGNFPPYRDVIPKDSDRKASLGTDTLASAVRRAALLTNEESKGVKLSFTTSGLTLSSRAPEMGEATIDVDLPQYAGEPIDIGFNPHYVLDALKVVEEDEVTMEFKAPNKPGVLRTGGNFVYVIMPVNLS